MAPCLPIELMQPFIEATQTAFRTMLGLAIRRTEVRIKRDHAMFGEVSAVIGLSRATSGTCALSFSRDLARQLIQEWVLAPDGAAPPEPKVNDVASELVAMVADGAKAALAGTPHAFDCTLPMVVSGGAHEVFHRAGTCCMAVLFETPAGAPFALEVCVSPAAAGRYSNSGSAMG